MPSVDEEANRPKGYIDNNESFEYITKELFREDVILDFIGNYSLMFSITVSFTTMLSLHVECGGKIGANALSNVSNYSSDLRFIEKKLQYTFRKVGEIETITSTFERYVKSQGTSLYFKPQTPPHPQVLANLQNDAHNLSVERDVKSAKMNKSIVTYHRFKTQEKIAKTIFESNALNWAMGIFSLFNTVGVGIQLINHYGSDSPQKNSEAWELWGLAVANSAQLTSAIFALPLKEMRAANITVATSFGAWLDESALGKLVGTVCLAIS